MIYCFLNQNALSEVFLKKFNIVWDNCFSKQFFTNKAFCYEMLLESFIIPDVLKISLTGAVLVEGFIIRRALSWSLWILLKSYVCNRLQTLKVCKSSKRQLKRTEYLKNKLESNGVLFLQETHSVSDDKNAWADDFKGQVFFSHDTSNKFP